MFLNPKFLTLMRHELPVKYTKNHIPLGIQEKRDVEPNVEPQATLS